MSEPLTFRTRYDTVLFLLLALGAVLAAFWVAVFIPFRRIYEWAIPDYTFAAVVFYAVFVLLALGARWKRLTLHADGLEGGGPLLKRWLRWESVKEVRLPGYGVFPSPGIVLSTEARKPWRLQRLRERTVRITDAYQDYERLLQEILAQIPHAVLTDAARRYLAAPRRVGWAYRLLVAVTQAGSLAAAGWALACVDRHDEVGLTLFPLAVGLGFLGWILAGSLDREWRWKSKLIAPFPLLLLLAAGTAKVPGEWYGLWEIFFGALALCVAWGIANVLTCLPWRRARSGIGIYAACVAAALGLAWWLTATEPIPFRRTATLAGYPRGVVWSLDGRALCYLGLCPKGDGAESVCHVVDAASLETRSYRLGLPVYSSLSVPRAQQVTMMALPMPSSLRFPDARHVLIPVRYPSPENERGELWVLDTATGGLEAVFATEGSIHLADDGFASPDRSCVVFLAGPMERKGLFGLSLADGSVRQFPTQLGLAQSYSRSCRARYRCDGALLVVEHEMPTPPKEEELAFYAFAPGETVPKRLYRAAGDSIFAQLSPDGRWAVVRSRPHRGLSEHLEIVDLLTGRSRPIDVPRGEGGCGFAWSRDGRTLACCYVEASEFHLTTFDPAVGTLSGSWFLESSWPEFLSLSADGRCAAYLGRSMLARQHVLDLETGRCVRLWRSPGWYVFHSDYLAWSPTGSRFAVSRIAPGLPRAASCVYLFEPGGR